jgi:hypothetical protein
MRQKVLEKFIDLSTADVFQRGKTQRPSLMANMQFED